MHTCFSPDSETTPERLVERCIEVGLGLIAVTDHNTIEGALAVREIAPFPVIVGEEVKTSEGEITGLFLKEEVPEGLSPLETVRRIKDQGGLVSLPHAFDRFRSEVISPGALEEVVAQADIIEVFNARNNLSADDRKAEAFAKGARPHNVGRERRPHARSSWAAPTWRCRSSTARRKTSSAPSPRGPSSGRRMSPLIHFTTTFTRFKKRLFHRRGRGG